MSYEFLFCHEGSKTQTYTRIQKKGLLTKLLYFNLGDLVPLWQILSKNFFENV